MYDAGYTNMSMYDGGWFEWQMNKVIFTDIWLYFIQIYFIQKNRN